MVSKLTGDKCHSWRHWWFLLSLVLSLYSFYFDKQRMGWFVLQNFPICLKQGIQDTSDSSDLPLPDSSHVPCRQGIVYPDNPICSMHLQVLTYSTVVHVLKGLPQFFNYPNQVSSIVRTNAVSNLPNVASSLFKPS